jgi:hypothetical protein
MVLSNVVFFMLFCMFFVGRFVFILWFLIQLGGHLEADELLALAGHNVG